LTKQLKETHPDWPLTVYLRNTTVDDYFQSELNVNRVVHGSFTDADTIKSLSKEHDIVINAASSFDPTLTIPILEGLKEKPSGAKGKLIHLSGAGNFIDYGTSGRYDSNAKVWNVSTVVTRVEETHD
jgi:hypothetical protein